ncbi:hypothetical protein MRB53_019838 [Persea americana]|uniref:Uncharacterized protein n=1 Tax=Persea americana TaxID=3435 RepID=A0ACC2KZ59_PERAE|nr:hypothetical protein MRB53_019838 [Persea americana]|eukprot:TRINITY_DN1699_c0_g1_i3.p1 TRINITY_DN1699_c0_g1~~TRINITY_DN1699_c0_g1_i3.p1  ORF type:complete len:600 (+),score=168.48 TRINITY_DN1699_c0_g1_i3:329-2128(+)
MAFWGVELKPENPYKHQYDKVKGRLHVSQATLGSGPSTKKSVFVQCSVGDKPPVLLCSLLQEKSESCPLNLEFEEYEDVIFSVIGPKSVHLTGFFMGPSGEYDDQDDDDDDSDSYGEDIAETETEESSDYDSEDEYDDDFINDDDDIEMFTSSPLRPNSGVTIEEIVDDEKPENGPGGHSQKILAVRSSGVPILESEDEDGFPVATPSKSMTMAKDSMKEKTKDDDSQGACLKRKIDAIKDGECDRGANHLSDSFTPSNDIAAEKGQKSKKKRKEKNKNIHIIQTEELAGGEATNVCKNDELCNFKVDMAVEEIVHNDRDLLASDEPKKLSNDKELTECRALLDNIAAESSGKLKVRKKNKGKEKTLQPKVAPSPETEVNACSDNNDIKAPNSKEATVEPVDRNLSTKVQDPNAKLLDHKSLDSIVDPTGDVSQKEGKKKKKKKKCKTQQGNTGASMEESGFAKEEGKKELVENNNEQKAQVRPSKPRTFSNGLVIEELSMGKPDGRKASPGNKVSVHYIGKLKKNEEIFDSNIGSRPFKFRLGVGQVIKGWDVGLAGMRVGDKRRLTIPPSMGYGSKGAGKIPANAWLVFDVELVDVQ